MKLCLPLIKDELPYQSDILHEKTDLCLTRSVFYQGQKKLESGLVCLAMADELPEEFAFDKQSALICIGKPPRKYIVSGLQLLILPDGVDLFTLANELGALFQRYDSLEKQLSEAVLTGKGIQDLVNIMHPFVGNELNIGDSTHHLVAHSYDTFHNLTDSGFDVDLIEGRHDVMLPIEVVEFFSNSKRFAETKTTTKPFIFDEGIFANRLLCFNIIDDVEYILRVIIGETERPLRSYDANLLEFFSEYVKMAYRTTSVSGDQQKMDRLADTLLMILAGEDVEQWRIERGLSVLNYGKDSKFLCLCMRPSGWDVANTTTLYYCEQITRLYKGVVSVEFQEDIVCLVDLSNYSSSSETFLEAVSPFIRDSNFRVGVSDNFVDVTHFMNHYTQAEMTLSFGIAEKPQQWIFRFRDYAVDIILREAAKRLGVRAICADSILAMYEYDNSHDSEYFSTTDMYLRNNLNITKTAQDLDIHRTTLLYRLGKISELFGVEFQNSKRILFYQMSLHLLRFGNEAVDLLHE